MPAFTSAALRIVCLALAGMALSATSLAQELGKGGSMVTGSAGPDGAMNASAQLEKGDAPKGTLAVVEPQSHVLARLKFKEAQTSMLLVDARSGLQVGAAEGSAKQTDFNLGGALFGGGVGAALGGFGEEKNGYLKVTAAKGDGWVKKILLKKP